MNVTSSRLGSHTDLCAALGIRYPIIQAPMAGGWTTAALAAAVSRAGGLGFLAAGRATTAQLADAIAAVKTARAGSFGVNFLLAPPGPAPADVERVQSVLDEIRRAVGLPAGPRKLVLPAAPLLEQFALALEERVPVISFAMGISAELIARAKGAGAFVLSTVTSVVDAVAAEAAGADAIVAQGIEAGGHRSTFSASERAWPEVGTLALVPQVVDAVARPVVAAGGIMDGRGVAAVLALGAAAAQLGTRFLLAEESGTYPAFRARLRSGIETTTTVTRLLTGRPARVIRNRIVQHLEAAGVDPLPWPYQALAAEDIYRAAVAGGDADTMALMAGQGLRLAKREMPAADIVVELVRDADQILDRLSDTTSAG